MSWGCWKQRKTPLQKDNVYSLNKEKMIDHVIGIFLLYVL